MNSNIYKMEEKDMPSGIVKDHLAAYVSFSLVPGTVRYWVRNSSAVGNYVRATTISLPDISGGTNVTYQANDPPFTYRHGEYNRGMWINSAGGTFDYFAIPLEGSLVRADIGSVILRGWYPAYNMSDGAVPKTIAGITNSVMTFVFVKARVGGNNLLVFTDQDNNSAFQLVTDASTPIYNRVNLGATYETGSVELFRNGSSVGTGVAFNVDSWDPSGYSLFFGNLSAVGLDSESIFAGDLAWYDTVLPPTLMTEMTLQPYQ